MKTLLWKLAGWMAEISELDTKPTYQAIEDATFIRSAPCLQGVVGSASSLCTTIQDGSFESSTCIIFFPSCTPNIQVPVILHWRLVTAPFK